MEPVKDDRRAPDKVEWVKIYMTDQPYQAEIVRAILEQEDIEAVIINRRDSSYHFGLVEVFTPRQHVLKANHLIKTSDL